MNYRQFTINNLIPAGNLQKIFTFAGRNRFILYMHTFLTKQTAEFPVAFYGSRKVTFLPPPPPINHRLTAI
jgi:hypothetical protein